jgi:hypothetical protein
VERRYAQFIAISLAIVLAGQLLQLWLFPKPIRDRQAPPAGEAAALNAVENPGAGADAPGGAAAAGDKAASETNAEPETGDLSAKRERRTLGSLDPNGPAGMLVTLTSRGAACR